MLHLFIELLCSPVFTYCNISIMLFGLPLSCHLFKTCVFIMLYAMQLFVELNLG